MLPKLKNTLQQGLESRLSFAPYFKDQLQLTGDTTKAFMKPMANPQGLTPSQSRHLFDASPAVNMSVTPAGNVPASPAVNIPLNSVARDPIDYRHNQLLGTITGRSP